MKKIVLTFVVLAMLLSTVSCSLLSSGNGGGYKPKLPERITVNYYDGITRSYSTEEYSTTIQCEHLAPSGQYITGLYDESGIQYADYTCKISLAKGMPEVLYARYKEVDLSNLNPETAWDEDPFRVGSESYVWSFNEEEFVAACLCNPYADVNIKVTFFGKSDKDPYFSTNYFYSQIYLKDNAVGEFTQTKLSSNYSVYTYTATVKAKQITNASYEIKVIAAENYPYDFSDDYVVKNFNIELSFDFKK